MKTEKHGLKSQIDIIDLKNQCNLFRLKNSIGQNDRPQTKKPGPKSTFPKKGLKNVSMSIFTFNEYGRFYQSTIHYKYDTGVKRILEQGLCSKMNNI